jgi:Na+/glutamate symporter
MAIFKKKIFWGIPVALVSFELFFGVLLGYLIGKFIAGKETGEIGKVKSLNFKIGNYKIHLHHWLYSSGILTSFILFNFSPPWPQFSFGLFGGLIVQGIISYSDWHKILTKHSK